MKETNRKKTFTKSNTSAQNHIKMVLRQPKQPNRLRQTDRPGKDRKNPRVQLSTSPMKVLRWNSVLIQMGAFKRQKYELNHKVKLQ